MDWQSIVIIFLLLIVSFWILFRLKGNVRNPSKIQIAMGLITLIDELLKSLHLRKTATRSLKKFDLSGWKYYEQRLDFLDPDTVTALKDSFSILIDFNTRVDAAAITAGTPPPDLPFDKLWDSLIKGRTGLSTWTRNNITRETTRGNFIWR